jgi:type VI secretion system protein ImpE
MNAKDLVRAGRLSEAREQLIREVKSSPADLGKRTLLFQVLSFCGEWGKAEQHLDAVAVQDSIKETGVQVYKNLLQAERERGEVLKLIRRPSFLPETPSYIEMYFAGWKEVIDKKIDEAEGLFGQIDAQLSTISGTMDGMSFAGFRDTDAFLSLFLEAIVHERYVWIPFGSIAELSISSPKTLFDLLWIPARIMTWEGLSLSCYLPVLYPDSFLHEDERVKLGRMTDWISLGGPFSKGMGQHVFLIGEEEKSILEIREVLFKIPGAKETNEKSD